MPEHSNAISKSCQRTSDVAAFGRFEGNCSVMFSAQTLQIGRMRRAAGIVGHGVVDVAYVGWSVAVGEATGEVAAADEVGQCR